MRLQTIPVYSFAELSDEAKQTAFNTFRQHAFSDSCDWEFIFDDACEIGEILGFDLRQTRHTSAQTGNVTWKPSIYFSGFCSQGDGACFESSYQYAKKAGAAIHKFTGGTDETLVDIANRLQALQKRHFYSLRGRTNQHGRYNHEYSMRLELECDCKTCGGYAPDANSEDEFREICADFARWIYGRLESEYEYQCSEECLTDMIEANNYEFHEDGSIA